MNFPGVGTSLAFALLFVSAASAAQSVDATAWASEAQQAFTKGNFKQAAKSYSRAVNIDAENPVYLAGLGRAYEREAEQSAFPMLLTKKARTYLERALRIDPNNVEALQDLVDLEQQPIGLCEGSLSKASLLIDHLETLDPEAAAREQSLHEDAINQAHRPGQRTLCAPVKLTRVFTDPILNPHRTFIAGTIQSAPDALVSQTAETETWAQGQ